MKKIFAFALATAAVLSCSKTETTFNQSEEITFMPVSRIESRAAVQGTNYTASQNFYVFANTTENQAYFTKVEFTPLSGTGSQTSAGLKIYTGSPAQYWPNVKALKFAGYTASGNTATAANTLAADFSTLTVTAYEQPIPILAANNDLMYFFIDNNGEGYTKGTDVVSPVMNHACSWLTINMMADASLVTYWKDLTVKSVKLLNVADKGNVTFKDDNDDPVEWSNLTYVGTPVDEKYYTNVLDRPKALTTSNQEFANVENNTIVIPQAAKKLYVTYSYQTPTDTDAATVLIEETKEINLATYTPNWAAGVHYTYNLTVTAEEIKIAPTSTTWDGPVTTPIPTPQQ